MKKVNNLSVRNYLICSFKVIMLIALYLIITTTASAQTAKGGEKISPDLFGLFFEDINYSADGGLYAELVQNRSFEYNPTEQKDWNPFS
jgi:alpha-N-arabinofuranosidase